MERVLVLGAKGMVGTELMAVPSSHFEVIGLGREELDITAEPEILRTTKKIRPGVVIHAAAYTDVDGCETNPDRAFHVNGEGTRHVARACREIGAKLVYISTDYVFDGEGSRPYREQDPVNPLSVYGKSKLEGERHVQRLLEEFTIVRTEWLFGKGGKNFVTTVLSQAREKTPLHIVQDHIGSPTYAVDLSTAIFRLVAKGCRGIFHITNSASCSWYSFAREIIRLAEIPDVEITPVDWAFLKRPAPRPRYSVLDCERLRVETGLMMRSWKEALKEFMEKGERS